MKKALLLTAVLCVGCAGGAGAQTGYTILHDFASGQSDGAIPSGSLASDGTTLYGATNTGGFYYGGALFSLNSDGTDYTILHDFSGGDGEPPMGTPLITGGMLYGATREGGAQDLGAIITYDPINSIFAVLHDFAGGLNDGAYPVGGLVSDGSRIYGVTKSGGTSTWNGTVFSFNRNDPNGTYTIVHNFVGGAADGRFPGGGLLFNGGSLYGTTGQGGTSGDGIVFSMKPDGSSFTILHSFAGSPNDGSFPSSVLISDGSRLYGATHEGGVGKYAGYGVVFSLDPSDPAGSYTVLHKFTGAADDSGNPLGSIVANGGTLYGMAEGVTGDHGVIYSLGKNGSGFNIVHRFAGPPGDGGDPVGGLLSNGSSLYGMTSYGGSHGSPYGYGTIFSLPLPKNYVELTANPSSVSLGGSVAMGWSCDFSKWKYQGVPVNVYVAAIKDPRVVNGPSSTADALAGGTVYIAGPKMASWYPYNGSVGEPTWSNIAFPPAPTTGTKSLTVPVNPALAGDWVFATAFIRADGSGPVRTDGKPVENSNQFQIQ